LEDPNFTHSGSDSQFIKVFAEAELYTREAERKRMAELGMGKLLDGVNASRSVPLSRLVPDGGTNDQKNSVESKLKK
jgi:hypothetical protein